MPREVASTVSHALAAPTSYSALRFGVPLFANDSWATARAKTGACCAQVALPGTSTLTNLAKFSGSSLVATRYAHGCSLLLDGAHRAASKRLASTSGATGLSLKARGLQRSAIKSCTGKSVGALLCMNVSFRYSELQWSQINLARELGSDFGHVFALKPCNLQFLRTRLAFTVGSGQCGGPVRSAASDVVHVCQSGFSVGHTDDDHAVVQKRRMKTRNGSFLAAMLGAGRREDASNFSDQGALAPQRTGLVQEIAHLRGHISETG